jgi:mono/diheme cytochrome c family protein
MKKQLHREEQVANTVPVSLTENGELPATGGKKIDAAERFATLCSSCHGPKGAGDGPGAAALNPKPRNLTDLAWQQATQDDRITKVIKNGGASVGLSATMAPWGAVLSDEEIAAVVAYIRTLGK